MRRLLAPFHAVAALTAAKSFRDNSVLGSPALNQRGLHLWRIRTAERMADRRRAQLTHLADAADRDAYARDGFVMRRDALPPDLFAALSAELTGRPMPAREMRQGQAVTRFIDLDHAALRASPTLRGVVTRGLFPGLLRYIASADAAPLFYLHAVLTDPERGQRDPQTSFHADTFHATAKGWLFLHDVAEADGPFRYVPGSHRLTPGRLEWEQAQSERAAAHPDPMHARGSFRATEAELSAMGYGAPVSFAVPANTLVVADTHGFHARGPSLRPSLRPAIYGSLRRNPFLPWAGLDPLSRLGLAPLQGPLFGWWLDVEARLKGGRSAQPRVGAVAIDDPRPRL